MSSIHRALSLAAVLAWALPATASAAGPSFASATRGEAPRACPAGSFVDLRLDDPSKGAECWRCPEGTLRTLEPVTSPRACTQPSNTTFAVGKRGTSIVALTAVAGWDFPLLTYRDGKRQ